MTTEKPESKRKGGGGKLARSETVTVRLDPKLRYLAELAARKQRRTVSSFIEWAVENSLKDVILKLTFALDGAADDEGTVTTLESTAKELWDVDPAERFARLAISMPEMLTHDEQLLWKQVEDTGLLSKGWIPHKWEGQYFTPGRPDWPWLKKVGFPLLRDHWQTFTKVARGELGRDQLPRFE
jgi:uncharacterized protein (DUF1778 family)